MGKVLLIVGPHGVGKTTLFAYARKRNEMIVRDGFRFSTLGYDLGLDSEFVRYQDSYIERICEEIRQIRASAKDGLVIRSLEESSYYFWLRGSPGLLNAYCDKMCTLKNLMVDRIVYLDAPYDVLQLRYRNDAARDMPETEAWYREKYAGYRAFWLSYPGVTVLQTGALKVGDVYAAVKSIAAGSEKDVNGIAPDK